MYSRRQFLLGSVAYLSVAQANAYSFIPGKKLPTQLLLSACTDNNNEHYIAASTIEGEFYYRIPIPERAHDSLYNVKNHHAVYFGRRPSQNIYIIDVINKSLVKTITASEYRHFYGHGVLDNTMQYLYVTENNYKEGKGCIGVYDVNEGYRKVNEFDSDGIGPHQLLLLPDNKTLVVANGGLLKHPSQSKKILNREGFNSCLSYIDTQTGKLLGRYHCAFPKNSLRHMAVNTEGKIFVGAQSYADDPTIPLVFSHQGENILTPFKAEEFIWQAHQQYTGSLAVNKNTLAVTSPRGNMISFWDINNNIFLSKNNHNDIAGLLAYYPPTTEASQSHTIKAQFFASTGQGFVLQMGTSSTSFSSGTIIKQNHASEVAWDNHLFLATNS